MGPGGRGRSQESSGGSHKTVFPEQKDIEWNDPTGPLQGVPMHPQRQYARVQSYQGVQPHLQGQDLQAQSVNVPLFPGVRNDLRPMGMYMNYW